jgi:3-hydroxymyristoyl/3-hydroxydecanoyl-(acyl carrier protein) dehydratase
MKWYVLRDLKQSDSKELRADIEVPQDSPWFSGHFPGQPVLPGIAQLGMVLDTINQSSGQDMRVAGVSRVRFKQIIRPNDQLRIIATAQEDHPESYVFRIMVRGELVCSGVMTVEYRSRERRESAQSQA